MADFKYAHIGVRHHYMILDPHSHAFLIEGSLMPQ